MGGSRQEPSIESRWLRAAGLAMKVTLIILLFAATACREQAEHGRLLVGGSGNQRSPAWMPDGQSILYSASVEGFPDDLFLFDFRARTERRLNEDPSGDNNPAISPDGRFVAFHSDRSGESDIYRIDLRTSAVLRLTFSPQREGFAAWSPDGRQIAFHSEAAGDPDIWLMSRDGSEKLPLIVRPGYDTTPAWSPKGDAIAFSGEDLAKNLDIWIVFLKDGRLVRETDSPEVETYPAWSPDSRRIVYSRGPLENGHSNLWIMDADGRNQRSLTLRRECDEFSPAWSPDGKRIAFESNCSGDFDIWVVDAPR